MKTWLAFWFGFTVALAGARAGNITGTVRAEGKAGTEQAAAGGPYQSRKFKFVERVNYAELRDFVVYIDQPMEQKFAPPVKPVQVVTQKDAVFRPHVLPIMAGTTVEWPNRDEIFHNVYSFSEAKQFDLGLYKDDKNVITRVTFDKPGRVDAFCSIHSKMHCIILVLENPFFASADAKGAYAITNVPPGTYRLKAWHERLPSSTNVVTVPEKGEVKIDFVLGIKNLPQY
ncbi:MAG: hypothetical protein HY674_11765 [Chloroflexi bacterium]|nr:hypothetical protein [Chloroflexota bacterium]